jgi:hypothetical protein
MSTTKKRTRLDTDNNSNFNIDSTSNSDNSPMPIEQQSVESKWHFDEEILNLCF